MFDVGGDGPGGCGAAVQLRLDISPPTNFPLTN
jgi:hypothetical protein